MDIDLTDFGINKTVSLAGKIQDQHVGGGKLIFLNEENHADTPAIRLSLKNACHLFDEAVVDFFGVEGYPEGVENDLLAGFGGQLSLDDLATHIAGQTDDQILDTATAAGPLRFATTLKLLRTNAHVVSVEDPELYAMAARAKAEWKRQMPLKIIERSFELMKEKGISPKDTAAVRSLNTEVVDQMEAEMKEYFEQHLEKPRNEPFVSNLFLKSEEAGTTQAAFLNLGRSHHAEVARLLRERGECSFIQIDPSKG